MHDKAERREYSLGLIGWPVEHSLSPLLHEAALEAAGLVGEYELYPVPSTKVDERTLVALLDRMRRGELQGLNVTIPHKQGVIAYLDALTPMAWALGAVNTITLEGNGLLGENTDVAGFLCDLERSLDLVPGSAIVLGAGGAARAVVFGLAREGWRVHVASRRLEQAERLVHELKSALGQRRSSISPAPLSPASLAQLSPTCGLIVNCTPVGMPPDTEGCPWPAQVALPSGAAVYDLVYNPLETALVRAARARRLPAVNGLGMLVEQAALSFERWTGQRADREAMRAALESSGVMTRRNKT
jgi:shikimate dehydrogenase